MAGLTDEQWNEVVQRLTIIDAMPGEINKIDEKIEDTKKSVNKIQIDLTAIDTALFGVSRNNGIHAQVKKNTIAIERLERAIPKRPDESTSKRLRGWIPVILCIIMSIASIYGWIESSITKNVQQTTVQANPTP